MDLAGYPHAQGLPFIVAGDFNCEICELEPACLELFLGAEWMTKGPVPGGHRAIDMVLASSQLRSLLDISWGPYSPWAIPHTGFRVALKRKALSLQVRVLRTPLDYKPAMGPDRPWEWHVQEAQPAIEEGLRRARMARQDNIAYSEAVDELYTTFCVAAETVLGAQAVGGQR